MTHTTSNKTPRCVRKNASGNVLGHSAASESVNDMDLLLVSMNVCRETESGRMDIVGTGSGVVMFEPALTRLSKELALHEPWSERC